MRTENGVSTVKAKWLPMTRSYGGSFGVMNPLNEVWEINGESAKLVGTTADGPAMLSVGVGVGGYGEYLPKPAAKPAEKPESKPGQEPESTR